MTSLNSVLHRLAEVAPFRNEADKLGIHHDIDEFAPVPAADDVPAESPKLADKPGPKPGPKS